MSLTLKDREDLSVFWDNHLRVAFEQSARHDLPAMVEASIAHVIMLHRCGSLRGKRAAVLLRGLHQLWEQWQDPSSLPTRFNGVSEDPYYFLEHELALACGISSDDLDVQLARSRNDLDSAVFRMILRRMVLEEVDLLVQTIQDTCDRAAETSSAVIIGMTHRRPAQPTTIAHVLMGLAESMRIQTNGLLRAYDELNQSPLGGAAFAGTDIPIDEGVVADLLGFDGTVPSTYYGIAGADHFTGLSGQQARVLGTCARWARVLQEWMSLKWVTTPLDFTQGSSIMPQKVNPVVCEHLVSMAGTGLSLMQAAYTNVTQSWFEDSNNATTDIQVHLWNLHDVVRRSLRMIDGLMRELAIDELPTTEEIIDSGATTTAVAEALAIHGAPWRGAHGAVGELVRISSPRRWRSDQVIDALDHHHVDASLAQVVLEAGQNPAVILERTGAGTPGLLPMREAISNARHAARELQTAADSRRSHLDDSRRRLLEISVPAVD